MTTLETRECISALISLFPTADLQDEELKLVANGLAKFDFDIAKKAIEEHRLSNDFRRPKLGQLFAAIRAAHRDKKPQDQVRELSNCEIYRQQNPAWRECSDHEVILRFWRSLWVRYATALGQRMNYCAIEGERLYAARQAQGFGARCRTGCWTQLASLNVTLEAAHLWAECIFAEPQAFSDALEDLRYNGIDTNPESPPRRIPDLIHVFRSPPEPRPYQPFEAIRALAETEKRKLVVI